MTSRERVIFALSRLPVDRVPRDLWVDPAIHATVGEEVTELQSRYPPDLECVPFEYPRNEKGRGRAQQGGRYSDDWGCVWEVQTPGSPPRLVQSPLADSSHLAKYRPPFELLKRCSLHSVNHVCAESSRFVLAVSATEPFRRLCYLRGRQTAWNDLHRGSKTVRKILEVIHQFNCRDMEMWGASDVDGVVIRDILGHENATIAPEVWADYFLRLYREYCEILHKADKFVFVVFEGNIAPILPELRKVGVDAVALDCRSADLEGLIRQYSKEVCFWLHFGAGALGSTQQLSEVRDLVRKVRLTSDPSRGGLLVRGTWLAGTRFQNLATFFEYWLEPESALAVERPASSSS